MNEYSRLQLRWLEFFTHKEDILFLALGSSQGLYSFDTRIVPKSFNFCTRSQDLYYSFSFYRILGKYLQPRSTIMLFCSLFSPAFSMEKVPSIKSNCDIISSSLGVPRESSLNKSISSNKNITISQDLLLQYKKDYCRGFNHLLDPEGFSPTSLGSKVSRKRFDTHYKYSISGTYKPQMLKYINQILELVAIRSHNIMFIISPVRSDYRNYLHSDVYKHFSWLFELSQQKYVQVVNLIDAVQDKFFYDTDHMIPYTNGPQHMIKRLNNLSNCIDSLYQ